MTTDNRAAVTVDFELFRHTPAFRNTDSTLPNDTLGLEAADLLLDAFDRADATVTFFIVSEIAEEHPGVVKRIASAGHEIASHTHSHRLLSSLSSDDRREELRYSRTVLSDLVAQPVRGFRAPAFDLYEGYFSDLADAGYEYDSSVNPCRSIPGWYGGEYTMRQAAPATEIDTSAPPGLTEVPIAVAPYLQLPVSGAWTRLLGRRYTRWATQAIADADIPPVLYFHPWEFCDLEDISGIPWRVTYRTGDWMRDTLNGILDLPLEFVSVADLVDDT